VKLAHLREWNEARRHLAARYRAQLAEIQLLNETLDSPCIYHLFPIRVPDRDGVAERLAQAGIATGVHYPRALPDQPCLPHLIGAEVPVARDWAANELSLPLFPELTGEEQEQVIDTVLRAIA